MEIPIMKIVFVQVNELSIPTEIMTGAEVPGEIFPVFGQDMGCAGVVKTPAFADHSRRRPKCDPPLAAFRAATKSFPAALAAFPAAIDAFPAAIHAFTATIDAFPAPLRLARGAHFRTPFDRLRP
jgi:hypothetical protein